MSAKKSYVQPSFLQVCAAVGKVTFFEIIRDKVLYNILVCGFLLFGLGFLVSQLSFIKTERVIFDFGLFVVGISCAVIAVFMGAGLITKEFDRRTAYVALSHPISKTQFIAGKFSGMMAVLFTNWILLVGVMFLILRLATDDLGQYLHLTFLYAILLFLLQSIFLSGIAIFFSTWSTTSLSVMMTIGIYLVGNNITQMHTVAANAKEIWVKNLLNTLATIVPNFEHFNLGLKVTYGLPVSFQVFAYSVTYGSILTFLFLYLSGILIRRKEI